MVAPNVSCLRALAVTLLTAGVVACGPGAATPMPEPPSIDASRIGAGSEVSPLVGPTPIHLVGTAGAVPAGAVVRVLNLDDTGDAVATTAGADGSFSLAIIANAGDELRFEGRTADSYLSPVDVKVTADLSGVVASQRPACVVLESGYALDVAVGAPGVVSLRNECEDEISVADVRLRLDDAGFAFDWTAPVVIASGASATVSVELVPNGAPAQDVLFLQLSTELGAARYPVSLRQSQ